MTQPKCHAWMWYSCGGSKLPPYTITVLTFFGNRSGVMGASSRFRVVTFRDFVTSSLRHFPLRIAYVGDGNNVCHSLMLLGATLGVNVGVACPPDYRPDPEIVAQAERLAAESDATITISSSPAEIAGGVRVLSRSGDHPRLPDEMERRRA